MAVWQFDLYVIHSRGQMPQPSDGKCMAPSLPLGVVYDFQEELAHYLGPPWLMLKDWLVFGPEKGNRIDVVFENETHASVSVRCDVREEAPQFLVLITNLTHFHGCEFFSPLTREFIKPDLELVVDAIRRTQT